MPEFYAVQCFQCKQFQVVQKRKDGKFNCKLCGNKQSVRKIAARSNKAADVRKFVQQINLTRGQAAEQYDDIHGAPDIAEDHHRFHDDLEGAEDAHNIPENSNCVRSISQHRDLDPFEQPNSSKWAQYNTLATKYTHGLGETANSPPSTRYTETVEPDNSEEQGFVTALPDISVLRAKKRKRQMRVKPSSGSSKGGYSMEQPNEPLQPRDAPESPPLEIQTTHATKRSRKQRRTETSTPDTLPGSGTSRWGRWDNVSTRRAQDTSGGDLGGGMFTSLGADEVVQEEILF